MKLSLFLKTSFFGLAAGLPGLPGREPKGHDYQWLPWHSESSGCMS